MNRDQARDDPVARRAERAVGPKPEQVTTRHVRYAPLPHVMNGLQNCPDDDDLFMRHGRVPETGYGVPHSTPALRLTLLLNGWIDSVIELLRVD